MVYAAGGGYGHCVRALSLSRAAKKENTKRKVALVANQSAVARLAPIARSSQIELFGLNDDCSVQSFRDQSKQLLSRLRFSSLIVDSFPRGIVGELTDVISSHEYSKVLVHRDISPEYLSKTPIANAISHFCRILVPGEPAPLLNDENAIRTAPWVLLDSSELFSRCEARKVLGTVDSDMPVCLISLSGKENERDFFSRLAVRLAKQLGDKIQFRVCGEVPNRWQQELEPIRVEYWPLLKLLGGADWLIGAGGYNTVFETRLAGARLFGFPQKRLYDRQRKRIDDNNRYASPDVLISDLKALESNWESEASRPRNQIRYENGVHRAVQEIAKL
ncbi:hypothetical protein N8639_00010 [bacterium]|nr:hypothetical protein [bacterium]